MTECVRWGTGPDRCIRPYDHLGQCEDADGNTTMSLAAKYLTAKQWRDEDDRDALETADYYEERHHYEEAAAAADMHSSDVGPGRIDPWEER